MFAILQALGMFVADLFKSRSRLEAENLFLRPQLTIAMRRAPPRLRLRGSVQRGLSMSLRFLIPGTYPDARSIAVHHRGGRYAAFADLPHYQ
jgi:hypothetical protein